MAAGLPRYMCYRAACRDGHLECGRAGSRRPWCSAGWRAATGGRHRPARAGARPGAPMAGSRTRSCGLRI